MAKKPNIAAIADAVKTAEELAAEAEAARSAAEEAPDDDDADEAAAAAELEAAKAITDAVEAVKEIKSWLAKNQTALETTAAETPSIKSQLQHTLTTLENLSQRISRIEAASPASSNPPTPDPPPIRKPTASDPGPAEDDPPARPEPAAARKYRPI